MADLGFEGNGLILYQSKLMLLLQNLVVMEEKATQPGKNLQLVCVWWNNQNTNS